MKKILSVILILSMCFTLTVYAEDVPQEDKVTFGVITDVHVASDTCVQGRRLQRDLEWLHQSGAVTTIVTGDLTNLGTSAELKAYAKMRDGASKGDMQVHEIMGNHDRFGKESDFTNITGSPVRDHFVINGYHFILVSPDNLSTVGVYDSSKAWLEEQLEEAAKDSDKPIFVFAHHPIKGTLYVSDEWYGNLTQEMFNDYPQVVLFTGHSHAPNNNPRSIWQGGFTAVNAGALSYFTMEEGYGQEYPNDSDCANQILLVSVEGSKVTIQNQDRFYGKAIEGQAWTFDANDKEHFPYTSQAREEASNAPSFSKSAEIKVDRGLKDIAKISFMQATAGEGDVVHSYHIVVENSKGKVVKDIRRWSDYIKMPMADEISYSISGLKELKSYKIYVYPVNAYGKEGVPITTKVSPLKKTTLSKQVTTTVETVKERVMGVVGELVKRVLAFADTARSVLLDLAR
ncbi:MAG: metallophosphoesterase [Clostridia bacterium]|nr:metallophosphoesterase [Clostridia bacterium]